MNALELLNKAANKHVLFCGERIIDLYYYVAPLGRPTKDAILSVELTHSEEFEGGIIAARKHARPFCRILDYHVGGQQITKLRYVETSHFHKLFQVYMPSIRSNGKLPDFSKYDTVVVIDYGHGMADKEFINATKDSRYLAINVQTNSGNYGYNLCTKYPRADYLCVDEAEARLATQNRTGDIKDSLHQLRQNADKVVITLGKAGAVGSDSLGVYSSAAFTDKVVDTMGAGDAFFAITALVAEEAYMPDLLRIGNAAGALKSQIIGHQRSVTKNELIQYLDTVRPADQ